MTPKTKSTKRDPIKGLRTRIDTVSRTMKNNHKRFADGYAANELKITENTQSISVIRNRLNAYDLNEMPYLNVMRTSLKGHLPLSEPQIRFIIKQETELQGFKSSGFALTWSVYATIFLSSIIVGPWQFALFTGIIGFVVGALLTIALADKQSME